MSTNDTKSKDDSKGYPVSYSENILEIESEGFAFFLYELYKEQQYISERRNT